MHRSLTVTCLFLLGVSIPALAVEDFQQQETQQANNTDQNHKVLQKLIGEWTCEGELNMGPGVPPEHCTGNAVVRAVGDNWVVMEITNKMQGVEMTGILTVGYDSKKQQHVGTWIDSVNPTMYMYEGSLNDSGNILALHTEGPSPADATKKAKMRDQFEIVDADHLLMTSAMETAAGEWFVFSTAKFSRKN